MGQAVVNEFQPSLAEWFKAVGGQDALSEAVRAEDNTRTARFDILHAVMGLPIDQPVVFEATELRTPSPHFSALLEELGDKPCAIRLVPKKDGLPKLRNRGLPLRECYETWFLKQVINPTDYLAEVYRHSNTQTWAATFVVKPEGVVGEMVQGLHTQLTHGEISTPIYRFVYNFSAWEWSAPGAEAQAKRMLDAVRVRDQAQQKELQKKLGARFASDYMQGYFEATIRDENELIFIDYNRLLADHITIPEHMGNAEQLAATLTGLPACPGRATGKAVMVNADTIPSVAFAAGDILVCDNTDVRYLPFMKRAGAIVTERGGLLSHAAIVARELKIPCVVGVKGLLSALKSGETVTIDGGRGMVERVA